MEPVETLRNPSKYTILGVWVPVDLLLEEPPCTGDGRVGTYSLSLLPLDDT
jgi:ATP-dependent Zn protease